MGATRAFTASVFLASLPFLMVLGLTALKLHLDDTFILILTRCLLMNGF